VVVAIHGRAIRRFSSPPTPSGQSGIAATPAVISVCSPMERVDLQHSSLPNRSILLTESECLDWVLTTFHLAPFSGNSRQNIGQVSAMAPHNTPARCITPSSSAGFPAIFRLLEIDRQVPATPQLLVLSTAPLRRVQGETGRKRLLGAGGLTAARLRTCARTACTRSGANNSW